MNDLEKSKKKIRHLELEVASMKATLNIIQNSVEFKVKGEKNESNK